MVNFFSTSLASEASDKYQVCYPLGSSTRADLDTVSGQRGFLGMVILTALLYDSMSQGKHSIAISFSRIARRLSENEGSKFFNQ